MRIAQEIGQKEKEAKLAGDSSKCQLGTQTEYAWFDALACYLNASWILRKIKRLLIDPGFLFQKAKGLLNGKKKTERRASKGQSPKSTLSLAARNLNLEAGEFVRVKSLEEIEKTLDNNGKTEGLYFMNEAMAKFCGGTYVVKKNVVRFFDERRGKMQRLKNVVILDGVFCEKSLYCGKESAGCDRTCFIFWKEVWLERTAGLRG